MTAIAVQLGGQHLRKVGFANSRRPRQTEYRKRLIFASCREAPAKLRRDSIDGSVLAYHPGFDPLCQIISIDCDEFLAIGAIGALQFGAISQTIEHVHDKPR
jgi:hypothetical protein